MQTRFPNKTYSSSQYLIQIKPNQQDCSQKHLFFAINIDNGHSKP